MLNTVQKHSVVFFERLRRQFFYMVSIATMFAFIGWAVPQIYYQYFDKTAYIQIAQPVITDKENYAQCEEIGLTIVRDSAVNVPASNTIQLLRIIGVETTFRATLAKDDFIVNSGHSIVNITKQLPCDAAPGKYYIEAIISYEVNGIQKVVLWKTNVFSITTQ